MTWRAGECPEAGGKRESKGRGQPGSYRRFDGGSSDRPEKKRPSGRFAI